MNKYIAISIILIGLHATALFFMGQVVICDCGYVKFWHGVVQSSENSQHIADWYTFSHIIHGIAFYGIGWLLARKRCWPVGFLLVLAISAEVAWELFENTDFIINRYRETTISLDYFGDSIINSVGDVLSMMLGFFLAYRLPLWTSIAIVIGLELFVGYWIRDNLFLNIIMLLYPLEIIKTWQMEG